MNRKDSRLGAIKIRGIVLFIGLVAITECILPWPLDLLVVTSLAALTFSARLDLQLVEPLGCSILVTTFLPAWQSNQPADFALGLATSIGLAPLLVRMATWRDRSGRWDLLDPLVIASAPLAFITSFFMTARLFGFSILVLN